MDFQSYSLSIPYRISNVVYGGVWTLSGIAQYLTDIPLQREEYEVIYGTRRNASCHITSILRAVVEYLFNYTPNLQSYVVYKKTHIRL